MRKLARRYAVCGWHRPARILPPAVRYRPGVATVYVPEPVDPWADSGFIFHWSEAIT